MAEKDRLQKKLRIGNNAINQKVAKDWIRQKADQLRGFNTRGKVMQDLKRKRSSIEIGGMYFYVYDPKTKDKLPLYDTFPLVIPFDRLGDGFMGLNLHYLPQRERAVLLDKLSRFTNDSKYDDKTRFTFTYEALMSVANFSKIAIKRYLFSHVRSRFIKIDANEWEIAIFLPVENFVYKK